MLPFPRMLEYANEVLRPVITGTVQTITPSPLSARYGHGVCSDNVQYIYSFGGYTGGIVNTLTRIDTTDMSTTNMSTGPSARYGASVTLSYLNGKLYTFGGTTNTAGNQNVTDFWEYDIASDTWTNLVPLVNNFPGQRGFGAAGNGKVYLSAYNSVLYTFDIESSQWDNGIAWPGGVSMIDGTLCTDGGDLVFGCFNTSSTGSSCYIYQYNTSTGAFFKGSVNTDIRDSHITYYNGFIYAYRSSKVYAYDYNNDKWTLLGTGGTALRRNGLCEVQGKLYSICGDTNHNANGGAGNINNYCANIT